MLEYDTIHVSERIDVNKTSGSQGCIICHYWYFNFKVSQKYVMVAMI